MNLVKATQTYQGINLTWGITFLMDDDKIVIKLTYKGSTINVWSKTDYFIDASSQLNDTNVY